MTKQAFVALVLAIGGAGLLVSVPYAAAQMQRPPSNPFPPSFYHFNPGYYGPYYPGQYQYGNVQPQAYNNYASPAVSGYGQIPPLGTSSGTSMPYRYPQYGYPSLYSSGSSAYTPSVTSESFQAPTFSPPADSNPVRNERAVQADVHLPTPDAELWVEGQKTVSAGTWRRFLSPPLVPGDRYVYEFRARWSENGREVNQTRRVRVRAGEHVVVDFAPSR